MTPGVTQSHFGFGTAFGTVLGAVRDTHIASISGGITPDGTRRTAASDVNRDPSDPTPTHARGQDDVRITRKFLQMTNYYQV